MSNSKREMPDILAREGFSEAKNKYLYDRSSVGVIIDQVWLPCPLIQQCENQDAVGWMQFLGII